MKKNIFLGLIILIGFFSCDEIKSLLTFTFSDEATFTIESQAPIDLPFNVPVPEIQTNSSQAFENNHTNANLVKEVILKELKLKIESPDDMTFSFLRSIAIDISAPGLDTIQLAYIDDIPTDAKEIYLNTTDQHLDAYIKQDSYNLDFKTVIKEIITRDVDLKAEMRFQVTADPL
jgi:hypothetical protein